MGEVIVDAVNAVALAVLALSVASLGLRFVPSRTPTAAPAAPVQAAIRAGEARLNGSGRVLIRKSGTEPLIRVMAEAEDAAALSEVVESIVAAVEAATR